MFIAIGGGSMKEMTALNDYIVSKLEHIRQEMERKPKIMFLPQAYRIRLELVHMEGG